MKRYAAIALTMISLNAWGVDTVPSQQKTSVSSNQDSDTKKKALNSFLSGGPRSTKIVTPEGEQKKGADAVNAMLNSGPRSTKIVKPDGEQKKGLDGFLNGGARSTKIVKPSEANR